MPGGISVANLRVSWRHVIPALHDAPDLPADGRVAERHDGQWQHEDEDEHVDLVGPPEQPGFRITHAPVRDDPQSDLFMRLERKMRALRHLALDCDALIAEGWGVGRGGRMPSLRDGGPPVAFVAGAFIKPFRRAFTYAGDKIRHIGAFYRAPSPRAISLTAA